MKRYTLLLIALAVTATAISAYEPPSDSELTGWWESLTRDERLAELRKLDRVEHETPTVDAPEYLVTVTDSQVILTPQSPLVVEVAHVGWSITLPEQSAAYEPDTRGWWTLVATSSAIGLALGVVVTTLVN